MQMCHCCLTVVEPALHTWWSPVPDESSTSRTMERWSVWLQAKMGDKSVVRMGRTTAGRRRDREPVEKLAWAMQEVEHQK